MSLDYTYILHIVGAESSFNDYSVSGGKLQYHLSLDVIGDNKEYEAFLEMLHACAGGVNTSHFIISEIYVIVYCM